MQPTQPPLARLLQQRPSPRLLDLLAVVAILVAGVVFYAAFFGYRTVELVDIPAGATITLNGHQLTVRSLQLRPGSYDVVVTSPTTAPYASTMSVGWFSDLTYKPRLSARSINSIASSLLGAVPETTITPQLDQLQRFDSDNWAAGLLSPTDMVLVVHYNAAQKQWVVAYCDDPAYPNDLAALPADVRAYVQSLQHVGDQ